VVVLSVDGFGLGSMRRLMGDAASGLVGLDYLTEEGRLRGTMLVCETLFGVKSRMCFEVPLC